MACYPPKVPRINESSKKLCARCTFLPTAYEVWGKVMFSQASVILFTEGSAFGGKGGLFGGGVCIWGGVSMEGVLQFIS